MPQLFSWSESPDSSTVKGNPGKAQKNPGVGKIEFGVQGWWVVFTGQNISEKTAAWRDREH